MTEHNKKLQVAIDALEAAKKTVLESLTDTPYSNLIIRSTNSIDQLLNIYRHTSGQGMVSGESTDFPPITNFMGEELKTAKEVNAEELKPDETELDIFKGKVIKLYNEFEQMDNDTILKTYVGEQTVIRGVAKKAGLENYADAELTYEFMDSIREAMIEKAELKATENNSQLAALKVELEKANDEDAKAASDLIAAQNELTATPTNKQNLVKIAKDKVGEAEDHKTKTQAARETIKKQIADLTPNES